jgi:hypothetical protein
MIAIYISSKIAKWRRKPSIETVAPLQNFARRHCFFVRRMLFALKSSSAQANAKQVRIAGGQRATTARRQDKSSHVVVRSVGCFCGFYVRVSQCVRDRRNVRPAIKSLQRLIFQNIVELSDAA